MSNRLQIAGGMALLAVCGCQTVHPTQLTGRTIWPPSNADVTLLDEWQRQKHDGYSLADSAKERENMVRQGVTIVRNGSAGAVACFSIDFRNSVPSGFEREMITPVARECVASSDILKQWAGMYLLGEIGEDGPARQALQHNYQSLLTRPDPPPRTMVEKNLSDFKRTYCAVILTDLRVKLVEMVGRYRITEAGAVLDAIADDPHEWSDSMRVTAQQAVQQLRGNP